MKAVLDVCPPGDMNRCLCHDNSKVKFPFDYRTFFLDCRPKRVRTKEECVIVVPDDDAPIFMHSHISYSANVTGIPK